jgi:hypothetical protein
MWLFMFLYKLITQTLYGVALLATFTSFGVNTYKTYKNSARDVYTNFFPDPTVKDEKLAVHEKAFKNEYVLLGVSLLHTFGTILLSGVPGISNFRQTSPVTTASKTVTEIVNSVLEPQSGDSDCSVLFDDQVNYVESIAALVGVSFVDELSDFISQGGFRFEDLTSTSRVQAMREWVRTHEQKLKILAMISLAVAVIALIRRRRNVTKIRIELSPQSGDVESSPDGRSIVEVPVVLQEIDRFDELMKIRLDSHNFCRPLTKAEVRSIDSLRLALLSQDEFTSESKLTIERCILYFTDGMYEYVGAKTLRSYFHNLAQRASAYQFQLDKFDTELCFYALTHDAGITRCPLVVFAHFPDYDKLYNRVRDDPYSLRAANLLAPIVGFKDMGVALPPRNLSHDILTRFLYALGIRGFTYKSVRGFLRKIYTADILKGLIEYGVKTKSVTIEQVAELIDPSFHPIILQFLNIN